jgi:hypothetical protein
VFVSICLCDGTVGAGCVTVASWTQPLALDDDDKDDD